jgi:hypothetical protein
VFGKPYGGATSPVGLFRYNDCCGDALFWLALELITGLQGVQTTCVVQSCAGGFRAEQQARFAEFVDGAMVAMIAFR